MGVLLYMFRSYFMHNWVLILATILMVISFYYGVVYESKNGLIRIVTFGTSALLLVLISLILEYKQFYQNKGFLVSLRNASFTLYLSHTILLNIFYYSGMSSLFNSDNTILPLLGLICIVLICIGFSLIYFKYIEYPIYQKSIKNLSFFK